MAVVKSPVAEGRDRIIVRELFVRTVIGVDAWERWKEQPVKVTLTLYTDISRVGATDQLANTTSYGTVTKSVTAFSESAKYKSLEALANGIAQHLLDEYPLVAKAVVKAERPKSLLHARTSGVEITRTREYLEYCKRLASGAAECVTNGNGAQDENPRLQFPEDLRYVVRVSDLKINTIIGVNPWERMEKQDVVLNLTVHHNLDADEVSRDRVPHNYRTMVRRVTEFVEASTYKTVEALVTAVARIAVEECKVEEITVSVEKPNALAFAEAAGVEITRNRRFFEDMDNCEVEEQIRHGPASRHVQPSALWASEVPVPSSPRTASSTKDGAGLQPLVGSSAGRSIVFVALGTNLGVLHANISEALMRLEATGRSFILDTSFLYQTGPMYVMDQPNFLNAVCKVSTDYAPEEFLACLKQIEGEMGRVPTVRNGPRIIDLDILFFDDIVMDTPTLTIPHPLMTEREFVLRPLCDIAPNHEHPTLYRTCQHLLNQLMVSPLASPTSVHKVMPIGKGNSYWRWGERTLIMGILNMTPDSFSDGGMYEEVSTALQHARKLVEAGADIIDVGGQSTRPNAVDVGADVETARVVPVIRAIKGVGLDVPVSVDTFRASVARAAVEAGADFVNDVSGGSRDPEMLPFVASAGLPVCLMHMRGDSKTMMSMTAYEGNDVVGDIRWTLRRAVDAALAAGVRRWDIVLDPGLGFAKTPAQTYEVVRKLPLLFARDRGTHHRRSRDGTIRDPRSLAGFPCLVGPSRKAFLGKVTGKESRDRVWGTAASCAALVANGADILRVHDVAEMVDVVKVADAVWRTPSVEDGKGSEHR